MENLNNLWTSFKENKEVKTLIKTLQQSDRSNVYLKGLIGSQFAFVLGQCFQSIKGVHMIIADDKESGAYLYNDLMNLMPDVSVFLLPDSFKHPLAFEEVNRNNILARTETINKISSANHNNHIIVTYPEALFERVVDPVSIKKNSIEVTVGEDLDLDFLIEMLNTYGFEGGDFVYEPGQFSIRGGIIDIFSYGNEWPYRVELFDEEVESIRMFNPMDQLSIRNIAKISLVPNVNGLFKSEDKSSIFNVLPDDITIWQADTELLLDKLQAAFDKLKLAEANIKMSQDEELRSFHANAGFIYPREVLEDLQQMPLVFYTSRPDKKFGDLYEIDFKTSPQPDFNKHFSMLIEDLNGHSQKGYTNYIFSDNVKQFERFNNIFDDLEAKVLFHPVKMALQKGFVDHQAKVVCYTDHQIFNRFHRYQLRRGFTKQQSMNLRMIRELRPGDFVTHIDFGVGRYSGLEKIEVNGRTQESIRLIYKNNDILYVSINALHKISKFVGKEGTPPQLNKLGGDTWKALKRKTKKKVKDIATELIKLYAQRKAAKGFAFSPDGHLQNELEASFIYEDTPDQYKATNDVKEDMEKPYPMDRLICGDVGFGKTEVAIRAAFKAVLDGKQVAILVPTTILALQHYHTLRDRLREFPVDVDYINRFKSTVEKRETLEKLAKGQIDIIIGTHALLGKDVKFKDLGLLIVDEEQKFGVAAKEKLRNSKINVDTLTLTATPIPRTLQFSLVAARDLSIIATPPPNRQPIHTERRLISDDLIKETINYEIYRGGQVFFVHNRVKSLPDLMVMVSNLCPDANVAMAHGQMPPKQLEDTLVKFIDREFDVLVCTNIIETGLDISNANTIIINNAHQFGLSDLYQLRGRVGRSNKRAFCYLLTPPLSVLSTDARKRLKTLEEFTELGSGIHIAMRDLDIRGAGNLLGGEQSGFISDIGYQTYQKILEEAIIELKENEFKELFKEELKEDRLYVKDVTIDTDLEMHIPDKYVSNIQERLNLYTRLDQIENDEELDKFKKELIDRFGPLPISVFELFNGLKLRWKCRKMGFEKISLKNDKLICFFLGNPQSPFYETALFQGLLGIIAQEGGKFRMKQGRKFLMLINEGVKDLKEANQLLTHLFDKVMSKA